MPKLNVYVNEHSVQLENNPQLSPGSKNWDTLKFTFDESWDGFTKYASLTQDKKQYYKIALDANGECLIGAAPLALAGRVYIGAYGEKTNTIATTDMVGVDLPAGSTDGSLDLTVSAETDIRSEITSLKSRVTTLESSGGGSGSGTSSHTHSNKSVLDAITSQKVSSWDGKYTKPNTGIPKSDLASDVQTAINDVATVKAELNELTETVEGLGTGTGSGVTATQKSALVELLNEVLFGTSNISTKWSTFTDAWGSPASSGGSSDSGSTDSGSSDSGSSGSDDTPATPATPTLSSISVTLTATTADAGTATSTLISSVTGTYSDGSTQAITGYSVSPATISEGSNTVTVSYSGKTATQTITGTASSSGGSGETTIDGYVLTHSYDLTSGLTDSVGNVTAVLEACTQTSDGLVFDNTDNTGASYATFASVDGTKKFAVEVDVTSIEKKSGTAHNRIIGLANPNVAIGSNNPAQGLIFRSGAYWSMYLPTSAETSAGSYSSGAWANVSSDNTDIACFDGCTVRMEVSSSGVTVKNKTTGETMFEITNANVLKPYLLTLSSGASTIYKGTFTGFRIYEGVE